jgi:hypothetical protein
LSIVATAQSNRYESTVAPSKMKKALARDTVIGDLGGNSIGTQLIL